MSRTGSWWPSGGTSRLRSTAAAAREVADLAARPGTIAYAGPGRSSNAGDGLLFDAYRHLLPGLRLATMEQARTPAVLSRIPGPLGAGGVVLGGGTLIGERRWREVLEAAVRAGMAVHAPLGIGVLDPRSDQFRHLEDELRRWRHVLADLGPVPVRGPLSVEILADLDVPSVVVGDPVLALSFDPPEDAADVPATTDRPSGGPRRRRGRLGINVGASRPARTFGSTATLVDALGVVAQRWRRAGGEVVLFSVWPPDDEVCRAVADRVGPGITTVRWEGGDRAFVHELRACEVVIAQKLHAAVLAAIAERPLLVVEYQAKCRDLAASLDIDPWCVRQDEATPERLQSLLDALRAEADDQVATVRTARSRLVAALHDRARSLATTLHDDGR